MMMISKQPRKQRRFRYSAPLHVRRKYLSAHLTEELLLKYNRRSFPLAKGDTVKVMRGEFKDHVEKIAKVNLKKSFVEIEGAIMTKADGKKIAKPIHPSNLLITKLNLTDPVRRARLERVVPEEVKKEIEKEAKEQLKEIEEEQKRVEEERKIEKEATAEEQKVEETSAEEEPVEVKKEQVKEEKDEKKTVKKTASKKTSAGKTPASKKEAQQRKAPKKKTGDDEKVKKEGKENA